MDEPRTTLRLRRMRLRLTGMYTLVAAVSLAALAAVAITIDDNSRRDALDGELGRVAEYLLESVSADGLTIELPEDDLDVGFLGYALLVADESGRFTASAAGSTELLPASLESLGARVHAQGEVLTVDARASTGVPLRALLLPVHDENAVLVSVLVVADDPTLWQSGHTRLIWTVIAGCGALLLVAAAAGHVLSGRAMRPAAIALRRQEQFLAEASHELRTPLTTLRLLAEEGARSPTPEILADIASVTDRMGRLVSSLLTRARAQAGTLPIERIPLRLDQLVESVIENLGDPLVTLRAEPTIVRGDPDLLEQAVRNLVENALRHSGTEVEVTVGQGRVVVRDHGPGFGDQPSPHGTGIGLSLVRWIADLHRAPLVSGNAADGGAIVTLAFPQDQR